MTTAGFVVDGVSWGVTRRDAFFVDQNLRSKTWVAENASPRVTGRRGKEGNNDVR
jgi:hypothetical protein